jgi:hypothetical protein
MKYITLLIISFLLYLNLSSCSSTNKTTENFEKYPEYYSFESAKILVENEEYELALWYYINLYSINKEKTIKEVVALKSIINDLPFEIKKSYATHGIFDPKTSKIKDGELIIDGAQIKSKGKIADELINAIK